MIDYLTAFDDNYIWLIKDEQLSCVVVDPGDAEPVINWLSAHSDYHLKAILITHHHQDHTGGIAKLKDITKAAVYAPYNEVTAYDIGVRDLDSLDILSSKIKVLSSAGHTKGHVSYLLDNNLFCGDTLFAAGCGRIFEGTAAQMYASLVKLSKLPLDTKIYCAHEYTLSNLRFAAVVEPFNDAIAERIKEVSVLRKYNLPTVPSLLSEEIRTNPFLRCHLPAVRRLVAEHLGQDLSDDLAVFTALRSWKDNF